jgi:hypothetical protein
MINSASAVPHRIPIAAVHGRDTPHLPAGPTSASATSSSIRSPPPQATLSLRSLVSPAR